MVNIAELAAELIEDEGVRLVVYDDATGLPLRPGMVCKGHPTIGIGRALDVRGITHEEGTYLCGNDITAVVAQLDAALPWFETLDDVRATVLANMSFNLGTAGMLGFHSMLTFVEAGKYDFAADAMQQSKWAGEVGPRATRLVARMRTGIA
jgi:lysozyme